MWPVLLIKTLAPVQQISLLPALTTCPSSLTVKMSLWSSLLCPLLLQNSHQCARFLSPNVHRHMENYASPLLFGTFLSEKVCQFACPCPGLKFLWAGTLNPVSPLMTSVRSSLKVPRLLQPAYQVPQLLYMLLGLWSFLFPFLLVATCTTFALALLDLHVESFLASPQREGCNIPQFLYTPMASAVLEPWQG